MRTVLVFVFGSVMTGASVWASNVVQPQGHEIGNGGDVVICDDYIEVLDLFEARMLPPYRHVSLQPRAETTLATSQWIADRIDSLDQGFADYLRDGIQEFFNPQNVRWISGVELKDVDDAGYIPIGNCRMQQIAIQIRPFHPFERKYIVDQDLWSRLNTINRAALILHEVIYSYALRMGQRDSIQVRKMVGLLFSAEVQEYSAEDFINVRNQLFPEPRLPQFSLQEIGIYAHPEALVYFDLSPFVTPSLNPVLSWQIHEPVTFAQVDPNIGRLSLDFHGLQPQEFVFSVLASNYFSSAAMRVRLLVMHSGDIPPLWIQDEFTIQLSNQRDLSFDLLQMLRDDHPRQLKFMLLGNHEDLLLAPRGILKGVGDSISEGINKSIEVLAYDRHYVRKAKIHLK